MKIKKSFLVFVAAIVVFFGIRHLYQTGTIDSFIPRAVKQPSSVPPKASVPDWPVGSDRVNAPSAPATAPVSSSSSSDKEVRFEIWAWNADMALIFANGGPLTTPDSLMAKYGVKNLKVLRNDDTDQMRANLVTCAKELASGAANCKNGAHFISIMGDQTGAFFQAANPQLKKICPDCYLRTVDVVGRSNGEDKVMGPPEWKENPQLMRGALIAGAVKEGDWNMALKLASDNGIPNNPDFTTYDPDAINWVNTTYVDAADKWVSGYCENGKSARPVVKNGKRTGEKKDKCLDAIATWTPEDVKAAMNRGGLVSIVSSKSQGYRSQMPAVVIGIHKWMKENRALVEGMIAASAEAGDQINNSKAALRRGADLSAKVYKEKDGAYWMKYFEGTIERDKQGLMVELGGSAVTGFADRIQWFGLAPGTVNLYGITYKVFGDIVVQQYPNDVPEYPPLSEVLDLSYVKNVLARTNKMAKADLPTYSAEEKVKSVVSRKAVHINFETGKATFTSAAMAQLEDIFNQAVLTGLVVEVEGYTDSVGSREANMNLSRARAIAVKKYLEEKSPVNFPKGRVRVKYFGPDKPIASNTTEEGRAQNRRVEIILGSTE